MTVAKNVIEPVQIPKAVKMVERSDRFSNPPIVKRTPQAPIELFQDMPEDDEDEYVEVRDFGTDTGDLDHVPQISILTTIDDEDDIIDTSSYVPTRVPAKLFPQLPQYEVVLRMEPSTSTHTTQPERSPIKRNTDSSETSVASKRIKMFLPRKPSIRRKPEPKHVFKIRGPTPMIVDGSSGSQKRRKHEVKRIGKRPRFDRHEETFDHDVVMGTLPESSYNIAQQWQSIN